MSQSHTPGPWLIGDDIDEAVPDFYSICSKPNLVEVARCEELADAQLVVAAPDLLALAKLYASECGDCNGTGVTETWVDRDPNDITKGLRKEAVDCPDCADIRSVIAKAEGRS